MIKALIIVVFCCLANACSKKRATSCVDAVNNHLHAYYGVKSSSIEALQPLQNESLKLDFQLLLNEYSPGSDVIKLSDGDDSWPPCYISVECSKINKRAILEVVFNAENQRNFKVYSITWKTLEGTPGNSF